MWLRKLFYSMIDSFNLLLDSWNSEEDLVEALKASAANEFVSKLPNGLDTIIGCVFAALRYRASRSRFSPR